MLAIMENAIVIGAGPAGLMAAEMLANAGVPVSVIEAKPTAGRKFLMAGKSGLNLTKDEPFPQFLRQYEEAAEWLTPMLTSFSNADVARWAEDLGQPVFTGTSGRVFPRTMKASPLLRAWLSRLRQKGVIFHSRWRWNGWDGDALTFATPDGHVCVTAKTCVLALGGASWPRLGSDGGWADLLGQKGVETIPFQAANVGLHVNWSGHMDRHFGAPVKATQMRAGGITSRGEFVITKTGLEGGSIYSISKAVRQGMPLTIDLLPDLDLESVITRLSRPRGKTSLANHLRKTLRLQAPHLALAQEFAHPLPSDATSLGTILKSLRIRDARLGPLDRAISTAGGVPQRAVDENLMLRSLPGIFVAGEMLDWEAPTGGYLLSASLATGRHAGLAAAGWQLQNFHGTKRSRT